MKKIDAFLNSVTMYRLVLYGLVAIIGTAFTTSLFGVLGYSLGALAGSLGIMLGLGFVLHQILVRIFSAAPSTESWLITVLILFLALKPAQTKPEYAVLVLGMVLAMTSKYILTFNRRHIFNPVAIALVVLGLLGSGEIYWWVGSSILLPVVTLVGLLVIRKVRRFTMVALFLLFAVATFILSRDISADTPTLLKSVIVSGPLIFFAAFMLTEPLTSPRASRQRILFAVLVGFLFGLPFALPPLFSSPEFALVIGNLLAFIVSSKQRVRLEYLGFSPQGRGIYEFSFKPDRPLHFTPGQYVEWTLPHRRTDKRGDRRYFTIASSPTEDDIKLVVRIDQRHSSSFKRALLVMHPDEEIWISQLSGEFVLPRSTDKKLVFIAGGIGITPFRSMVQQLVDTGKQRSIVLYYSSTTADGFSYASLFDLAVDNGVKANYLITGPDVSPDWAGKTGYLKADVLQTEVPDYQHALFYLSGPNAMVRGYKKMLRKAGVPRRHIKTDYFPGF